MITISPDFTSLPIESDCRKFASHSLSWVYLGLAEEVVFLTAQLQSGLAVAQN